MSEPDRVDHPRHYTGPVPGIECVEVAGHFNFCRGSAIKYIWRAGSKNPAREIEDLRKAIKFLELEIERLQEAQ